MKTFNFSRVMAAMAIVAGMSACSHDSDLYDQSAKENEFSENFKNDVLGGQPVDVNQNWSTSEKVTVKVTTDFSGTLKIYTVNPMKRTTAPLYTQTITPGEVRFAVAKPRDAKTLFASLTDSENNTLRVMQLGDDFTTKFVGTTIAASRSLKAMKVVKHNIEFPDAPDASLFATDAPEGCLTPSDYYNNRLSVHNYVLNETTAEQEPNFYQGNFNLYVKGTKTLKWTNPGDGSDDMNFYVLPGANLTFTGNCFDKNGASRFKMYISEGATVTFNEGTNSCIHMFNKGTVIVKGWKESGIYGNGIIYNEGTMKFEGTGTKNQVVNPPYDNANTSTALGIWNGEGRFVNAGTLESKGLLVEGSGKFLNLGKATISGYTVVNSNQAVWINDGTYTTQDYAYSAGSQNVWNNCRLTVNNLFAIWLGDSDVNAFQMDGGSSTVTKDLKMWGPSRIKMGGNSLLNVTNQAMFSCRKANYGIYGPTTGDDWAVFQAKDVISVHNSWESMIYEISYGGKLYVAFDSHFANGWSGQYPWYDQGTALMSKGQTSAPYSIPAGKCNPGYNDNGENPAPNPQPEPEPTMYYYYAFEDLGTTKDFDFNDVVLRLSAPNEGKSDVQIVAAGGTLETYVTYGTGENPARIGGEVHAAMGSNSTKTMINTFSADASKFAKLGTIEIGTDDDVTNLPFAIEVKGNSGEVVRVRRSVENNGKAPLVIVVNGDEQGKWFWATERTNITTAYPKFGAWGADVATYPEWYTEPNSAAVVSY